MTGWIILGAAVMLALLLIAPIRIVLKYDKELFVDVRYLFFHYRVSPADEEKEKKRKAKKQREQAEQTKKAEAKALDQQSLPGIVSWVKIASDSLSWPVKRILKKGCITHLALYMDVAGASPADAAFEAGRLNAYVYSLYGPIHESFKKVCKPDIQILPDYYAEKADLFFKAHLHISAGVALASAIQFGTRFVVRLIKKKQQETPAAAHHPAKI